MSKWNILEKIWKHNKCSLIENGDSWDIHYEFNLLSGETKYLVFSFGNTEYIHPTTREIRILDLGNQITNVEISTYTQPTIGTLGNDISNKVFNSNINEEDNFDFIMYDETSTVTDDGIKLPYSATLSVDKKSVAGEFIERAYVAPVDGYIVLKFVNNGSGEVGVEYNAGGHRIKVD